MSVKIKKYLMVLLGFSVSIVSQSQSQELFKYEYFINQNDTLNYRILYPKNFETSKKYPLIVFLHGAGERGNNNESQLIHGSKLFLDNYDSEAFPCIVLAPQCPEEDYWSNVKRDYSKSGLEKFKFYRMGKPTKALELVIALMDNITKNPFKVSAKRY